MVLSQTFKSVAVLVGLLLDSVLAGLELTPTTRGQGARLLLHLHVLRAGWIVSRRLYRVLCIDNT